MKLLVVGGGGRAGARIVAYLAASGHGVRGVSRSTGVDTVSGAGVAEALGSTDVVIDTTAPRSDALEFFTRSTQTLIEHGRRAGVRHHLVLSVVGADRMQDSPYMRAKVAQEDLVRRSGLPFTIVRATQFHDFVATFADVFADRDVVRVPDARLQPVALDDVAAVVGELATARPLNDTIDVAGPEVITFAEAISRIAPERRVLVDGSVRYFGAALRDGTLLPGRSGRLGTQRLARRAP